MTLSKPFLSRSFLVISLFFMLSCTQQNIDPNSIWNNKLAITNYKLGVEKIQFFYPYKKSTFYIDRSVKHANENLVLLNNLDYQKLTINQQVDYHLLYRKIKASQKELNTQKKLNNAAKKWLNKSEFIFDIAIKSQQGFTPNATNLNNKLIALITDYKQQISQINSNTKPLLNADEVFFIADALKEQKKALNFITKQFNEYLPGFKKETNATISDFNTITNTLSNAIFNLKKAPNNNTILGKEKLKNIIKDEKFLAYSPEEILQFAEKFFEKSHQEVLVISSSMGFEDDWQKAYKQVKKAFVPLGKQPEKMLELQNEAIDFIEENNMVTIPSLLKETWKIGMIPGFLQQRFPFFLGGPMLLIAYPSIDMNKENQLEIMEMNNQHFARSVIFHEIIPGHVMQVYMEDLHKKYRKGFVFNSLWSEGMAFYWELLLYEKGFAKSNEDKLGMLFFQKLRAARVINSINYHLGKWTKEECIAFLKEKVGANTIVANSETSRAINTLPIDYLIGGLQFMQLKKELVDSKKMSLKTFNDKLYQENFIPTDLLKHILLDENIPRKTNPNWQFLNKTD